MIHARMAFAEEGRRSYSVVEGSVELAGDDPTRPWRRAARVSGRVRGQALPQTQPRSMDSGLHRRQTEAERFGHLGIRQPLDVVQPERHAIIGWEIADGGPQIAPKLGLNDRLFRVSRPVGQRRELLPGLRDPGPHLVPGDLLAGVAAAASLVRRVGGNTV